MIFLPLFNLRVTHSYYGKDLCSDFRIEPDRDTARLLKNHRCAVKSLSDGLRVITLMDTEGKPFIPLPINKTFTFHLRLQNPDFPLFTDMSDFSKKPAPFYSNKDINSGENTNLLLLSRISSYTEDFVVFQSAQQEHFTLSGQPLAGLGVEDFKVHGAANVKLSGYNPDGKVMTVDSSSAQKGKSFRITYPVAASLDKGVFADVDILINDSFVPSEKDPLEFHVHFTAKKAWWIYYFITDLKNSEKRFHIVNTEPSPSASAPVFSNENSAHLNQEPDPFDNMAEMLAQKYPQMQRFRFVSDDSIDCSQTARKNLELHMDGSPLVESLPNPLFQNYSSLKVKDNANLHQRDALFHVVKYITHPFQK